MCPLQAHVVHWTCLVPLQQSTDKALVGFVWGLQIDLMEVFGYIFGTSYTYVHLLRAEKHTPLTCILWNIIFVKLNSFQCIEFGSCILWKQLEWLGSYALISLDDCRHLVDQEVCGIVERFGDCCWLQPLIVSVSCAHSPWEIHKEQLQWDHGWLECLFSMVITTLEQWAWHVMLISV